MATLCLIETSRFGLLETELLELLAIQPTKPGAKTVKDLSVEGKLPMAKVCKITRARLFSAVSVTREGVTFSNLYAKKKHCHIILLKKKTCSTLDFMCTTRL